MRRFTSLMTCRGSLAAGSVAAIIAAASAQAVVSPPAGYIYSSLALGNTLQSCLAAGPGGTFVGIGKGFRANATAIVLAKESGELRLVASGFNSLADCAYDAANDVLYVTDNADNGDFGFGMSPFGAQSGDTIFKIPSASTANGLGAPGLELLAANAVPAIGAVAIDGSGNLFVGDAVGNGGGSVLKIVGVSSSTFLSGFDLTGGLAINPANGNLFVAESIDADLSYKSRIRQFTAAGAPVLPDPFALDPDYNFGSYDLAFNSDGRLLVSGGTINSFNVADATYTPFSSGLSYTGSITVDPFTHRVEVLSAPFPATVENNTLHRFTPVDQLSQGGDDEETDCLHEAYGLQVVEGSATCVDGAACDADATVNDACLFPIGFCLNVNDPDLAGCSIASNITAVSITAKPASSAIANAASRLAAALPLSGSSCTFSDGYYVPVKVSASGNKKAGKAAVKVKVTAADDRKDSDSLKMVCQPAP